MVIILSILRAPHETGILCLILAVRVAYFFSRPRTWSQERLKSERFGSKFSRSLHIGNQGRFRHQYGIIRFTGTIYMKLAFRNYSAVVNWRILSRSSSFDALCGKRQGSQTFNMSYTAEGEWILNKISGPNGHPNLHTGRKQLPQGRELQRENCRC